MLKATWCDSTVTRVIECLLARCPTAFATQFQLHWNRGEWDALVNMSPSAYLSCTDHTAYQAVNDTLSLLKKLSDIPTTFNRDDVARATWWECENQCFRTNQQFVYNPVFGADTQSFISVVREKIKAVLGPIPTDLEPRFGPGTYVGATVANPTIPDKLSGSVSYTSDALLVFRAISPNALSWAEGRGIVSLNRVDGNRHAVVPKNARTSRSIGIEPSLNLYLQLGIGTYIRNRLRRKTGIDLDNGQATHRRLAREASIHRGLATIDLKAASDTLALEVVRLLVPPLWFELLSSVRSRYTVIDGKRKLLEKFSSMGNGYTFELETLVFWAIVQSAQDLAAQEAAPVLVYGDDIIVDDSAYTLSVRALTFFGFTINKEKSFHGEANFRESCGADWFRGVDVRGYSPRVLPSEPQHWIAWANGIRRLASRDGCHKPEYLRKAWGLVVNQIPAEIRNARGPEALGDQCLHVDEPSWAVRVKDSIRYVRCYVRVSLPDVAMDGFCGDTIIASVLSGSTVDDGGLGALFRRGDNPGAGFTSRLARHSYRLGWTAFS